MNKQALQGILDDRYFSFFIVETKLLPKDNKLQQYLLILTSFPYKSHTSIIFAILIVQHFNSKSQLKSLLAIAQYKYHSVISLNCDVCPHFLRGKSRAGFFLTS